MRRRRRRRGRGVEGRLCTDGCVLRDDIVDDVSTQDWTNVRARAHTHTHTQTHTRTHLTCQPSEPCIALAVELTCYSAPPPSPPPPLPHVLPLSPRTTLVPPRLLVTEHLRLSKLLTLDCAVAIPIKILKGCLQCGISRTRGCPHFLYVYRRVCVCAIRERGRGR
jgi:hypothetical protein